MAVASRSPIRMHVDPSNVAELNRAFKEFGRDAVRRVTRAAMSKTAREAAKLVRAKVKSMDFKHSGKFLLKSIGHKLFTDRQTGRIGAKIGPRRRHSGYFYQYRRTTRGKLLSGRIRSVGKDFGGHSWSKIKKGTIRDLGSFMERSVEGKPVFRNPTRYAHLLELGTSRMAAKPFLRPVMDANRGRFVGILKANIRLGLVKEAGKLRRRTARFKRQGKRRMSHRRNF